MKLRVPIIASFIALLSSLAAAKVHVITVGHYSFTFTPAELSGVAVGDDVEFQFPGSTYTVVRADYEFPARSGVDASTRSEAYNGSVWSGGVGGLTDYNTWTVKANDTRPIWYYDCNRWEQSMVGVINPPSDPAQGTLKEWKEKHYNMSGYVYVPDRIDIPENESCPEGEKGGRLAKDKYGLCLVDPVHASATATKEGCNGPLATGMPAGILPSGSPSSPDEGTAWKLSAGKGMVAVAGVLGVFAVGI